MGFNNLPENLSQVDRPKVIKFDKVTDRTAQNFFTPKECNANIYDFSPKSGGTGVLKFSKMQSRQLLSQDGARPPKLNDTKDLSELSQNFNKTGAGLELHWSKVKGRDDKMFSNNECWRNIQLDNTRAERVQLAEQKKQERLERNKLRIESRYNTKRSFLS